MAGRVRRAPASPTTTEIEYRKLLGAHRTSRGTLKAFGDRLGVPYHRLRWWKSELARRDRQRSGQKFERSASAKPPTARAAFVPVRVVPDEDRFEQPVARPASRAAAYEVLLRGSRLVRVPGGFEPAALTALVAALEAVPC